jgi:WD40 repeat protein
MTQQPPSRNPQDLSLEHTTQQVVQTNYGQVIARVENLYVYYSAPRTVEPTPQTVDTSDIGPNPYRGLRAFREGDHAFFFGRRQQTYTLWKTLKALYDHPSAIRFLPVYGPSGSGKSSLVRAGLLPMIGQRSLSSQEHTRVAILEPRTQPLWGLALALARMATGEDSLIAKAREFNRELQQRNDQGRYDGLWRIVRSMPGTELSPVIVVVDQFEEVYSQCKDKHQRQLFIDNLLTAAADKSRLVIVVVTLRSDFLGETQAHPWLNRLFSKHGYLVPAMNDVELKQAISEPAAKAGHPLDAATVKLLIQETQQREGALPLLQFALEQIWEGLREGKAPGQTLEDIGGIGGALAKKAEAIFRALKTEEKQAIARRVFLGTIQLGEGTRYTRHPAQVSDLVTQQATEAQVREVIERFAWHEARLLTLSADNEGNETVEVTHEALIEHWQRLNDWLKDNWQDIRFQRRLEEAVRHWNSNDRAKGLLWRSPDLDLLRQQWQKNRAYFTSLQKTFLETSEKRENTERNIKKLGLIGLISGFVFTTSAALFAMHQFRNAEVQRIKQYRLTSQSLAESNPIESLMYGLAAIHLAKSPLIKLLNKDSSNLMDESLLANPNYSLPIQRLLNHTAPVGSFSISPDGATLAVGTSDGKIHIWDLSKDIPHEIQLQAHEASVLSVDFSPDGKYIASGGADNVAKLWSSYDGKQVGEPFFGHAYYIKAVKFSPDGKYIVTASSDKTIRFWDFKGISTKDPFMGHDDEILSVSFSPDGRYIASSSADGTVKVWNLEEGTVKSSFDEHLSSVLSVSFAPDSETLVSGGKDGMIRIWNIEGKSIRKPLEGHIGAVSSVNFSGDGTHIVSGGFDQTVRVWNREGQLIEKPLIVRASSVSSVGFSPKDKGILISSHENGLVTLWNLVDDDINGKPVVEHVGLVKAIDFSPDGKSLVSGGADGIVRFFGIEEDSVRSLTRRHDGTIQAVRFSKNGERFATGDSSGIIQLWNSAGVPIGEPVQAHTDSVLSLAFSFDGQTLVSGSADNTIGLLTEDGELLMDPISRHTEAVQSVAFSPDSDLFVSGSLDGQVYLWNVEGKQVGAAVSNHGSEIVSLDFSPDGDKFAGGYIDGYVQIWDADGALSGKAFKVHDDYLLSAEFSPDGQTLVTSGADKTVRLWTISGVAIGEPFKGHSGSVYAATFSPDGKLIASAGSDAMVRIWQDWPWQGWARFTCRRLRSYFLGSGPLDIEKEAQKICQSVDVGY